MSYCLFRASRRRISNKFTIGPIVIVVCWLSSYTVNQYLAFKHEKCVTDLILLAACSVSPILSFNKHISFLCQANVTLSLLELIVH